MTKYTINELANSKGVSPLVREALLQMADYKQLYEQVCEQYDVLAKELDATNRQVEILSDALAESRREVAAKDEALKLALEVMHDQGDVGVDEWIAAEAAIKQVLAAPVQDVSLIDEGKTAEPVQKPDLIARLKHPEDHYEFTDPKKANAVLMSLCQEAADALAAPVLEHEPENEPNVSFASVQECFWRREGYKECPAAQRQWVGLDNEQKQWIEETEWTTDELVAWIETKLKEKNT